jgi:hypothetical protein
MLRGGRICLEGGWGINVVFGPKYRPVTYVEKKYVYHKLILPSLRTEAL